MSLLMPVAVVLLVSAQLPLSTQLKLPTGETAQLAADYVSYEREQRVLTARGQMRPTTEISGGSVSATTTVPRRARRSRAKNALR